MTTELNPAEGGVPERQGTAPEGGQGVPAPSVTTSEVGPTAALPPNWDDDPRFKEWKSRRDTELAEERARRNALDGQFRQQQQQLLELQRQAEAAELERKVRDLPEDEANIERLRWEKDKANEQVRQMQQYYQEQENLRGWAQYFHDNYNVPLEHLNTSLGHEALVKQAFDWVKGQSPAGTQPTQNAPQAPGVTQRVAQHGGSAPGPSTAKARLAQMSQQDYAKLSPLEKRRLFEEAGRE